MTNSPRPARDPRPDAGPDAGPGPDVDPRPRPGGAPGPDREGPASAPSVLVVGSGWRFTSGMSYYTCRLANAFAEVHPTGVVLMRRLVPRLLYPGRRRVGRPVNDLTYRSDVAVFDGVDWYWGPSMVRALRFVSARRPDVVILQWWTGAVLHSYLLLAMLARRRGARVIIEWHEVQDTGEARIPGVTAYVRRLIGLLLSRCDGHVVHSAHDRELLTRTYALHGPVEVTPHGPYDHLDLTNRAAPSVAAPRARDLPPEADGTSGRPEADGTSGRPEADGTSGRPEADGAPGECTVLYFGVIRPYKGLEDLVAAFDLLPDRAARGLRLVIVGEPWEGWSAPLDAVRASRRREQITVVDRYVTDAEAARYFSQADAVALPYRRSSASGPLHLAMSAGLPVLVTDVGGLREAAADYAGTVFTSPRDPEAIARGLIDLRTRVGTVYRDPHSWSRTLGAYDRLFTAVGVTGTARGTDAQGAAGPTTVTVPS